MIIDKTKTTVPAMDRGLDILELVSRNGSLGYGEIVEELGLPTASAARLLKRLCQRGYLAKDDEAGSYQIGSAVKALLSQQSVRQRLFEAATPVLKHMRDETSQTAIMFYWNGQAWECIAKELHESSMTMQRVGETRVDIFNYPWGCFAYAQLNKEQRRLMLRMPEELEERLESCLADLDEKGYVGNPNRFLSRFCVPVNDESGDLIGALALGITEPNLKEFGMDRAVELVMAGGKQIEEQVKVALHG